MESKKDRLYENFLKKWEEVTELPPQTVGPLTPLYKRTVPFIKADPWRILIPLAFVLAISIALFVHATAAQITSFLQGSF